MTEPVPQLRAENIFEQPSVRIKKTGSIIEERQEWFVDLIGMTPFFLAKKIMTTTKFLPQEYSVHPTNSNMYAAEVTHDQHQDAPNVWIHRVLWKSITNITDIVKDPSKRPVLISMGTHRQQENPNIDFNGKPVATTAGEPIFHSNLRGYPTWNLEKNYATFPHQFSFDRDFVNSDTISIYGREFEPYTLYCPDVNVGHLEWEGDYSFHRFTATIYVSHKKDRKGKIVGWRQLLRNAGYHERKRIGYTIRSQQRAKFPVLTKSKVGQSKYPVYSFQAITMGTVGREAYPSSPVVLDPLGQAFRERLTTDPEDGSDNKGKVIGLRPSGEPVETSGITEEQWDEAVVEVQFYNLVAFNAIFPWK